MKKFIKWCFINLMDMIMLIVCVLLFLMVIIGACMGIAICQCFVGLICILVLCVIFESWLGDLKDWAFEEEK